MDDSWYIIVQLWLPPGAAAVKLVYLLLKGPLRPAVPKLENAGLTLIELGKALRWLKGVVGSPGTG